MKYDDFTADTQTDVFLRALANETARKNELLEAELRLWLALSKGKLSQEQVKEFAVLINGAKK